MNTIIVKKLMQYALAVAGENDNWKDQSLGPIHFIKYLYLADLAYTKRKNKTLTGIRWIFHHFGPYCPEVLQEIEPAMMEISAINTSFKSQFGNDAQRWKSQNPTLDLSKAEKELPVIAIIAIKRAVRNWGSDTQGLLHHVYNTDPMLRAAPGEALEFRVIKTAKKDDLELPLTKRQEKKRRAKFHALRAKLAEKRASRSPRRTKPMRQPRYDELYFDGITWLNELAGGPILAHKGVIEFDESIWKSETRRINEDS